MGIYNKKVRKFSQKLNKYYYYEKGTGKKVSRNSWERDNEHRKAELKSEFKVTEFGEIGAVQQMFTQSVPNFVRDTTYIHNRVVYFIKDGKIKRFDNNNAHDLLIELSLYMSEAFKKIKEGEPTPNLFSYIFKKGNKKYIALNEDDYVNFIENNNLEDYPDIEEFNDQFL